MPGLAVSVLGAGPWGRAMACILGSNGHLVHLWSGDESKRLALRTERAVPGSAAALPDNVVIVDDLAQALEPERVLFAIPPSHASSLLVRAAPWFRPEHRVVHLVRGLADDGTPMSRLITRETCVVQVGALAGPVVAAALWEGKETAAVIGSPFRGLVDEVCSLLTVPGVRVYSSPDLVGVEVGGAMRTPLALAAGVIREVGMGPAVLSVLLTRGIAEAGRLAEALGGERSTLSGLSGIGDWMFTANDAADAVVCAGMALARTGDAAYPEAERRVRTLLTLSSRLGVELPITEAVGSMLSGVPLQEALEVLMMRSPGLESA
ncbi:MAG: hypothetical protein CL928_13770 [Deltaproteobacteria bacterium]|nr:hypothetical protein [Deltaproteobacteria bacterium]